MQSNPLSTSYDRQALNAAMTALGEWPYVVLWARAHPTDSIRAWARAHIIAGAQEVRDNALAFIGEFTGSLLDEPMNDFDAGDLENRLRDAARECARLLNEMDRQRVGTFACYGSAA